ncbi:MAG: AAA family ATPase [Candidatus Limnocylindria bacterium]
MTGNPLSLIALEADAKASAAVRDATSNGDLSLVATVADLASLLTAVSMHRPALALIDLAHAGTDVAGAVRSVLAAAPETCVVVTGTDASPAVISRAVSAGARTFILRPFTGAELITTLREAHSNVAELRRMQRGEGRAQQQRGTLVAVYSPKGGVGCTTIATNLAVALARRTKKSVAIVDLDLQFGDVGVALDLRGANSIVELVTHADSIDAALIDEVFVLHESGIRALLAPENIAAVETVDPARVVRTLDALRQHFAYIVCDLWSSLDELTLATLRSADRVVLVTTPELPSLKNVRRAIAATTPLLLDERTQIVLNRHPGKVGVSVTDVVKNLGRPVSATIPSEGIGVTDAINQGISFFDSRARVRASRSYTTLADTIIRESPKRAAAEVGSAAV